MFPDVRQARNHDCSAACAKAVEEHYGIVRPLAYYVNAMSVERASGCDPRTIERFFRKAGYPVLAGELNLDYAGHFTRRHKPIICPITSGSDGHYVVIYHVTPRWVHLQDPWDGQRKMRADDFVSVWVDSDEDSTYRQWGIVVG